MGGLKDMPAEPVIISACLMGVDCRYNGQSKVASALISFCRQHEITLLPVCPEQLGGLATPRPPACFYGGDGKSVINGHAALYNLNNQDVTPFFVAGARQTLKIARLSGCRHAVFQDRSPSCGVHKVYLGKELTSGMGVTTALLRMNGMSVWTVDEFSRHHQKLSGKE